MAKLTLAIATLTASTTATDANAQRVLEACFALYHRHDDTEYTPNQKLDWIVKELIPEMLVDKARQFQEQQAVRTAQAEAAASAATFE